jgi:hypothetical protein
MDLSSPESEPNLLPCDFVVLTPINWFLMLFGAGVGYFIIGANMGLLFCKKKDNSDIILANAF